MRRPRSRTLLVFGVLLSLVLVGGIWLGGHPRFLPDAVRDHVVGDKDTRVVREAIERVHDDYYRKLSEDKLADAAIAGMIDKLGDRFSHYFDPAAYKRFRAFQNSEFTGIGVLVSQHPLGLRIAHVFKGSPAEKGGLKKGDVIGAVNGRSLKGRDERESVALIKGRVGTPVRVTYLRDRRKHDVRLTRAIVSVPVVGTRLKRLSGRKLGALRLTQFSSGAHAEVRAALKRLLARGAEGIVLDLRGNGGGLVSEAQLVASAFLRDGPIVTTRGRSAPTRTLNATGDPVAADVPLVVLVDRDTASAAEIVAGALLDRGRASLVGTRTFGKGVFQELVELDNGGALDITAGQYFTPSGRNLGGRGVKTGAGLEPRIRVRDDPKTRRDEALVKALRVVAGRAR